MARKLSKMSAPLGIERDYQTKLRKITTKVKDIINEEIVMNLETILAETEALRPTTDSIRYDQTIGEKVADLFKATEQRISSDITDFELSQITEGTAEEISAWNKAQITRVMKQGLGVDIYQAEPWLAQELNIFTVNNVNLIKSSNAAFLKQTETIVYDGMRRGLRHEEIAKQILGTGKDELGKVSKFKTAKNRANLIARDQVNKLNGQLNELRQKNAGISKYIWRTNVDGRERASHNHWNGMEFSWETGSPNGTNPGDEIQCRCYAQPVLDDILPK
jgi:SPP1 gp7 family putative phage head morphogenesis protein